MSQLREIGEYLAKIVPGQSQSGESESGNPFIAVAIQITHAAGDGEWIPLAPFQANMIIPLGERAWEYSKQKLSVLQFDGNVETPGFGLTEEFSVLCSHYESANGTRESWDLKNWGGGQMKPMNSNTARSLQARWKAEMGVKGKPSARQPGPAAKATPAGSSKPSAPKTAAPAPSPAPAKKTATLDEAWAAFQAANSQLETLHEDITPLWEQAFRELFPDRDWSTLTGEDYALLVEKASDYVVPF